MSGASVSEKAQRGTIWALATEIVVRVIAPISQMILARLLTPEAFGVVATVIVITSFAEIFANAGFQKFLIQHNFDDKNDFSKSATVAFWSNLAISILAWLTIYLYSDSLAVLVGNDGLGKVIWFAAFSLPITSFTCIQTAHYQKEFMFHVLFRVRIISSLVPLIITIPLAIVTRSYWALIWGSLAGSLAQASMLTLWSEWKPALYFSLSRFRKMLSYSWWILLESIMVWLTSYIGTFLVAIYLTQNDVGLYKTGMNTVNQILSLIVASTSAPLFAALSAVKDKPDIFEDIYLKYIRAISVFVIPLGTGIFIYRELVTSILLGSQWKQISDFIGLLGLCGSFTLIWGTYYNGLYNAKGRPELSVLSQILHLVVLVPVIFIGCNISFYALCIMRALTRLELIAVQIGIMKLAMKMSPWKYIKSSMNAVFCSGIMAAVGISCLSISDNTIWQFGSALLCAGVYFSLFRLFCRDTLCEAFRTFGIKLPVSQAHH